MSFSITDKRDFKREVRKIIDDLSCDPCYRGGGGDCCNDGRTTLMYDGSVLGSWTANQDNDNVITIPKSGNANDGRTTLIYGDTAIGSWSANQVNNNNVTIPEPEVGNGRVSITLDGEAQGSFTVNQTKDIEIALSVAALTRNEVTAICNNIYGANNG